MWKIFVCGVVLLLCHALALAWKPFASQEEFEEVQFSVAEKALVKVNAGWAKAEDQKLLFEVQNGLNGPIQCAKAQVELQDGKGLTKSFAPKFFVPAQSLRTTSWPGIQKGSMKSYEMSCSCFKKQGKGDCVDPARKN